MIIQNEQTAGVWIHGNTKHGQSYTAEYKREYQRKYRKENRHLAIQRERKCKQHKIDHPEEYQCECGNTGAVLKAGWVVCTRCDALEKHEIAQELRKRHTIRDAMIKWDKPTDGMIEKAELPEWMRLWAIASSLQSSAMMLLRIDSRIEDDGKMITVYGHGKYELPIVDNGAGELRPPGQKPQ